MNHLARIQIEFLKEARKWDDLSIDEQKAYLKRHPKSKRKITAKPRKDTSAVRETFDKKKSEFSKYDSAISDIGDMLDILTSARSSLEKGDKDSFDEELGDALEISITFPKNADAKFLEIQKDIQSNIDKLEKVKNVEEFDTIVDAISKLSDKLPESDTDTSITDSAQVLKKIKNDYSHDEFRNLISDVANSFDRPLTAETARMLSWGMFNSVASSAFNNPYMTPADVLKKDPMFIMRDNFNKAVMTNDKKLKNKYLDTAASMVSKLTMAGEKLASIPMNEEEIKDLKYMLKHKDDEDWQDGYAKM